MNTTWSSYRRLCRIQCEDGLTPLSLPDTGVNVVHVLVGNAVKEVRQKGVGLRVLEVKDAARPTPARCGLVKADGGVFCARLLGEKTKKLSYVGPLSHNYYRRKQIKGKKKRFCPWPSFCRNSC